MAQGVLGPQLQEARRRKRIKQRDLAARLGISAAYLNLIEHDKRRIAGKLLNDIVRELDIDQAVLTRNTKTLYLETLQQIARARGGAQIELEKLPEFISRYPGWSDLILTLANETEAQSAVINQLTEQLAHDPVLRETIHLILSKVTAIRSTSELLAEHGDMAETVRVKFCQNIAEEGARLTEQAENLLSHFDPSVIASEQSQGARQAKDSNDLEWKPQYEPNLESPDCDLLDYAKHVEDRFGSMSDDRRLQILEWAKRYNRIATLLPLGDLQTAARQHDFNPFTLAQHFEFPVKDMMYRLAHLPEEESTPAFGFIEVDNAGGVLFRKETSALRLPTRSGACPRWPLYRALSQPGQGITARLNPVEGTVCLAHAFAQSSSTHWTDIPPTLSSVMLYREVSGGTARQQPAPQIDVGFHCFVCSREECSDRRQRYQSL